MARKTLFFYFSDVFAILIAFIALNLIYHSIQKMFVCFLLLFFFFFFFLFFFFVLLVCK